MDRARTLQIANLVLDADELFDKAKAPHNVEFAVGRYPEIWIHENIGKQNDKCFRYQSFTILVSEKRDEHLEAAEAHIRQLMEGVLTSVPA